MGVTRFFKKLGLFLLLLAALLGSLELVVRNMFPAHWSQHKLDWMDAGVGDIEVAVFGTSHLLMDLDPHYLPWRTFDFAEASQDLYYGERLYEKYSAGIPTLKIVVIGVDPFSFGYEEVDTDSDRILDYLDHGIGPRRPLYIMQWLRSVSWLARFRGSFLEKLPAFLQSGRLPGTPVADTDTPPPGFSGKVILLRSGYLYSSTSMSENEMKDFGPKRAAFQRHQMYNPVYRDAERATLRRWIDLALRRNVKVLLVTTPTYVRFYEQLDPEMVAEFRSDLDEVLSTYRGNSNVMYRSYWPDSRFRREMYYDGDHLNAVGARLFTGCVSRDIDILLAATRVPKAASIERHSPADPPAAGRR